MIFFFFQTIIKMGFDALPAKICGSLSLISTGAESSTVCYGDYYSKTRDVSSKKNVYNPL